MTQYTDFGFELRTHSAEKSSGGMILSCQITFGAAAVPDDETDAQRDLESLILSSEIRTFGTISHVTSWTYNFPKVTESQPDAVTITFHYKSVIQPLDQPERTDRVNRILEPLNRNLLPAHL